MNSFRIDRLVKPVFLLSTIILVLLTGCSSAQSEPSQVTILQAQAAPQEAFESAPAPANPDSIQSNSIADQPAPTAPPAVEAAAPAVEPAVQAAAIAPETDPAATLATDSQPAAAPAQETGEQPAIGFLAPDFTLKTLDGQPISLSTLRGKSVVMNYWVTWCVPCLKEMPALEKLYKEYESKDLVVLSINGIAQDDLAKVTQTVSELGLTYPVVLDENDAVFKSYWLGFMPTSIFIDNQGVIRHIKFGDASEEEFRTKIEQLLAGVL